MGGGGGVWGGGGCFFFNDTATTEIYTLSLHDALPILRAVLLLFLLLASPLKAEEVVLGLSQDQVSISTNFDGSEITLYGAIKREAPIPSEDPLQVIVTISGPNEPVTVRRKDRRLGIWVNVDAVNVSSAPSFYAIATSAPWDDVINEADDLRHTISIPRAIRSVGAWSQVEDRKSTRLNSSHPSRSRMPSSA